ncbi:hypothetical protein SPRG_02141 [Saprolegnia parasitica CBS 223.65]|uniref:C2 DOCK-type domain-containing protein n=1 Tax=Saprolegnia parasitica (strain CBS 223.65) TaxID=695850 RepID=A0A067CS57_SAPPC|nr:hypothetical protein SPRG_02141 [Saprolegnia parasitica CBS 223.65]KDO33333.1 hypothetical protein SPRG_02141 [Saprolegnia parasitica CBS 223.65]|eukprot:XP_012196082.1 hypothetical protein SPRG_02141 [Saprolegnia parasitica CBS 223.65]
MHADEPKKDGCDHWCREVQPFCPPSAASVLGLTCSGPIAVSYMHVLFLYPLSIERFQHRNVLIKVQLIDQAANETPLPVFYNSHALSLSTEARCHVSYHAKTPSFEDEIKLALPAALTPSHSLRFSFYQVHCKKMPPGKASMDLFGLAHLPLLDKDGVVLDDMPHSLTVQSVDGDGKGMVFHCASRLLSSLYSPHKAIHACLAPMSPIPSVAALVARVEGLRTASDAAVRYHALRLSRCMTHLLRLEAPDVRQVAFYGLLSLLDKCGFTPYRKVTATSPTSVPNNAPSSAESSLVWQFIDVVFDDVSQEHAPVYLSIVAVWGVAMQRGKCDDTMLLESRKLALTHANVLLHLVLKSMALQWSSQRLPQTLAPAHEEALATLLHTLLNGVLEPDDGAVPALWLQAAIAAMVSVKDSAMLTHMTFPFLRMLVECEHFVAINTTSGHRLARDWLAQLLFTSLLRILDEQKEDKIKSHAVGIFRRLFVAQAHMAPTASERIALMYLPVLPYLLALTAPGKLLSLRDVDADDESTTSDVLKREVLVCLAYCLGHLAEADRKWFWKPRGPTDTPSPTVASEKARKPQHQRKVGTLMRGRMDGFTTPTEYDDALEAHVTSGMTALRQLIECFLADGVPWQQILSPETLEHGTRMSLLDIEVSMKSRHTNARLLQSRRSDAKEVRAPGATHRSLPRNWGKNYMAQRKGSMDPKAKEEGEAPASDFDACAKYLSEALVETVLTTSQAMILEFAAILDIPGRALRPNGTSELSVTSQAMRLLEAVVDLWYLLLSRIGHVHFENDLLAQVLLYIIEFLQRFQRSLFAESARRLMITEAWCDRVYHLATTSSEAIAVLAASLLCELCRTSFDQVGSFMPVKHALVSVVAKQLHHLPALRTAIERLQATKCGDGIFRVHFHAFLHLLLRLHDAWAGLHESMKGTSIGSPEGLEDAVSTLLEDMSPDWLPDVHRQLLEALAQYHFARGEYAEASHCHLMLVAHERPLPSLAFCLEHWKAAKDLAEKANLPEMALSIAETMLRRLQSDQCYDEMGHVLQSMLHIVAQLSTPADATPVARFFVVTLLDDGAVLAEYICKRSAFCHISDVVAGLEAALSYELQRKVTSVALKTDADRRLLLKVTPVDASASNTRTEFVLNTPFTRNANQAAYDKNQFVRRTILRVGEPFPWLSTRQRVIAKHEVVRCPIENAADDILRRTTALDRVLEQTSRGRPVDVKALTHLLKGSINTEVNGGAPEVIAQFLSASAHGTLLNGQGHVMDGAEEKRHMADLRLALLTFLRAALQVLSISRDAFRRAAEPDADVLALAPLQSEFEKGFVAIVECLAATYSAPSDEIVSLQQAMAYKLGHGPRPSQVVLS